VSKRWPKKTIIGLTGNIATGKSAVMRLAAEQGALTLDADKIVHQILATNQAVQTAVIKQFGPDIQERDGRINRAALAGVVFQDAGALARLEQILHPVVRTAVLEQINENPANMIMIEAIKLLEGKLAAECDQIWVTRCHERTQLARLMVCRGLERGTAAMRIKAQASQEEKVAQADIVIDTDGPMTQTQQLFEIAWSKLVETLPAGIYPAATPAEIKPVLAPSKGIKLEAAPQIMDSAPTAEPSIAAPPPVKSAESKAPPERLSGSKAAEIRKRMLAQKQAVEPESEAAAPEEPDEAGPKTAADIVVRRARPSDVPSILLLIQRATAGTVKIKRGKLLMALGDRSYLIGQQGTEISAVIGWNSENLIARIDQIYVYPPEAAGVAGPATLREIETTAVSLMCEVILAFPSSDIAPAVLKLFLDKQFEEVELAQLPDAWQAAAADSQPDNTFILMKKLRDTRVMRPV
jgi:dephospho-CoA kinase